MDPHAAHSNASLDPSQGESRQSDQERLAALFSQHRERLWRMVNFRMDDRLHGRVDPDDVLQDAYLAAVARMKNKSAQPEVSSFIWLRRMVLQTLTDLHRHHLGAQMRTVAREMVLQGWQYPQTTSASLAVQFMGQFTTPSQVVLRAEMFDQVEQAVASMEVLDQEVLALRHFEELSNSEVAEVLGIEQKAASIRYVRAIKRLQEVLSQTPGFMEGDRNA
jgi:RNA polymerase sigma-70 factor, ECF subfamily